jgi:metal-dependent hydrolase (beta-lactamase superfamily II)
VEPLLAEHGFSVPIQLEDSDRNILWDPAGSKVALKENMSRMKLNSASIAKIALSHERPAHYAALTDLIIEMDLLPKDKEWDASVKRIEIEE